MRLLKSIKFTFTSTLLILMFAASPTLAQNDCGFDNWNQNDDTYLDENEFDTALMEEGYFDAWDSDADGYLSEDEWGAGTDEYFGDYDVGDYSEWDENGDDQLDEEEFGNGVFETGDANDNDNIEENEWDTFDQEEDGLFC